ncbi:hypothetical protein GGH98_000596 [Coemansia sp. RSA 454]|nr:hypothetical protein GGH98_000596 [Coemansia sp. RSA 454]
MRYITLLLALLSTCLAAPPVTVGYYPSWKRNQMNGVDFSKYTHINVAFSIPNADGTFSFEDDWALTQIVDQVRSGGAKVLMSVGGWTGSNLFSQILKDNSSRQRLLSSMSDYIKANNLDGIDIDWEYPGRLGNTCNKVDAQNDTPNFLHFLQDLRNQFDAEFGPRTKLITLAVRVQPFDVNNAPSNNVSEFAKYVDFANIMAYDINGPWNQETGPNAPFNYETSKGTPLSFVSSIDAWTNAGWPASQLVAGLGFYGRSTQTQNDMRRDSMNQYQPQLHDVPLGDSEDAPWFDKCAQTTSASGTWQWKHLRDQGVLVSPDTPAAPWVRQWDSVSQTPWLFNPESKLFLSYDDPDSIRIKSNYAASRGLAGVMLWSVNMDHQGELVDAARSFGGNSTALSGTPHNSSSSTANSATTHISSTTPSPTSLSASTSKSASSISTSSKSASSKSTSSKSTSSKLSSTSASPTQTLNKPSDATPNAPCTGTTYRCVDGSGHNAAYLVCVGGKQVAASCALGTVCLSFQGSIMCGWPWLKALVSGMDSLLPFSKGS